MLASRTTQSVLAAVLAALVIAIAVVFLAAGSNHARSQAPSSTSRFSGPELPAGVTAAPFSLRDQNGRVIRLGALRGRVVVLTFIHSKCADACPLTVESIKGALNLLPGDGRAVTPIAISAAPAEDTIASRRAFLNLHRMNGRISYLNARPSTLWPIWNGYHVLPILPGKPDHTAFTLLIDKRGVERVGFPAAQMTPEALAHDLRVLQAEPA